jgi:hypothetical protein
MRRRALARVVFGEQGGLVGGAGGREAGVGGPGGQGVADDGAGVVPGGGWVGAEVVGGPREHGGEVGVEQGVGELGLELGEVVGGEEGAGGEGERVAGGAQAVAVEADAAEVADDEAAQAAALVDDEGVLQVELEGDAVGGAQAQGGRDEEVDVAAERGVGVG